MKYSISQLAAITGRDRRTVTDRLKCLDFEEGPDNAHLYESEPALAAIFQQAHNTREALDAKKIDEIELNMQIKRKGRIPLMIVAGIWDGLLQSTAATLKAAKGKTLTADKINEILGALKAFEIPKPEAWR